MPSPEQSRRPRRCVASWPAWKSGCAAELAKVKLDPPAAPMAVEEPPREFVWVNDVLPEGSTVDGQEQAASWRWVGSPLPVLNGNAASERTASGLSQHLFTGAKKPLVVGPGDKLVAHVYLDPANPPEQIMLQFNDGSGWEHRAYSGANKIDWGADNSPARLAAGALPPSRALGAVGSQRRGGQSAGRLGGERLGLHAIRWARVLGPPGLDDADHARGDDVRQSSGLGAGRAGEAEIAGAANGARRDQDRAGQAQRRASASRARLLRALSLFAVARDVRSAESRC